MRTPVLSPGPTTSGRLPQSAFAADTHASVRPGTTEATMASPTSGAPSVAARNDSAATRASSAVMRSGVVSDHVAKSAPSSTIPRLVVVFPTSTASTACAAPFSS